MSMYLHPMRAWYQKPEKDAGSSGTGVGAVQQVSLGGSVGNHYVGSGTKFWFSAGTPRALSH